MEPPRPAGAPLAAADEQALVASARRGDREAFGALVAAHAARVRALATRLVGASPDADDVAQEAFVRAWRALPRFRGDAALATWLHRITVRCSLDRLEILRGRRRRETGLEAATESAAPAPPEPDALARRRLERLIAALPAVQRAAITLFYMHDRSVQEVADILALNPNTVKTQLHRARAALRRAWPGDEGET